MKRRCENWSETSCLRERLFYRNDLYPELRAGRNLLVSNIRRLRNEWHPGQFMTGTAAIETAHQEIVLITVRSPYMLL